MSRGLSPATGRRYGLARVARAWRLSRATVYRPTGTAAMRRRAPVRARDRSGPARMPNWSATSAPGSWPRAYTVRATARSGPGCATPASAPRPGGSAA